MGARMFGTPGDLKLAALAISELEGGSDVRTLRTRARPLNRWFGCGTPARTQAANTALSMKDRIPQPVMQLAMKGFAPAAEVA
jgi:hypothetical protein